MNVMEKKGAFCRLKSVFLASVLVFLLFLFSVEYHGLEAREMEITTSLYNTISYIRSYEPYTADSSDKYPSQTIDWKSQWNRDLASFQNADISFNLEDEVLMENKCHFEGDHVTVKFDIEQFEADSPGITEGCHVISGASANTSDKACIILTGRPAPRISWDEKKDYCENDYCGNGKWDSSLGLSGGNYPFGASGGGCCGDDKGINLVSQNRRFIISGIEDVKDLTGAFFSGPYLVSLKTNIAASENFEVGFKCKENNADKETAVKKKVQGKGELSYYEFFFPAFGPYTSCRLTFSSVPPGTEIQELFVASSDEGWISADKKLCLGSEDSWQWLPATQDRGRVFPVSLGGYDVLSDGSLWYACNASDGQSANFGVSPSPHIKSEAGIVEAKGPDSTGNIIHQYICARNSTVAYVKPGELDITNGNDELFFECIGEDSSYGNAGREVELGEFVYAAGNLYYCSVESRVQSKKIWITDLDNDFTGMACDSAGAEFGLGETFSWTGSKCCGDDLVEPGSPDPIEYYNDHGDRLLGIEPAGCWANKAVVNGSRVADVSTGGLIANPCFERDVVDNTNGQEGFDGKPDGWDVSDNAVIDSPARLPPGPGSKVLKIGTNALVNTSDYISVVPNVPYTIDLYTSTPENLIVRILFYNRDFSYKETKVIGNADFELVEDGVWKRIKFRFSHATSEFVKVSLSSSDGFIYVDNVILSPPNNVMFYALDADDSATHKFYACNGADMYDALYDGSSTTDKLVDSRGLCTSLGDYFCSYVDGGAWSDEREGAVTAASRNTTTQLPSVPFPSGVPTIPDNVRNADNFRMQACCPMDACWNGTGCVSASLYEHDASKKPLFAGEDDTSGYRCVLNDTNHANWELSEIKTNWFGAGKGWCRRDQCLVDPHAAYRDPENVVDIGSYSSPAVNWKFPAGFQCINAGTWIGDHFCEDFSGTANWSTRTKLVATAMRHIAEKSSEYTLYCDSYQNALNYYSFGTIPETMLSGIFPIGAGALGGGNKCHAIHNLPCVNNFCVLETPNMKFFGVSLNYPLDEKLPNSDVKLQDMVGSCNSAALTNTGDTFKKCGNGFGNDNVWYNARYQLLIYGDNDFARPSHGFDSVFRAYLYKPLMNLLGITQDGTIPRPQAPPSHALEWPFLDSVKGISFNSLYMSNKSGYFVAALRNTVVDENDWMRDYYLVKYEGLGVDICKSVLTYDDSVGGRRSIVCNDTNPGFVYIATQPKVDLSGGFGYTIEYAPGDTAESDIWQELTSMLRLQ